MKYDKVLNWIINMMAILFVVWFVFTVFHQAHLNLKANILISTQHLRR